MAPGKDSLNNEYMRKAAEMSKNYPLYWQTFVEKAGSRYSPVSFYRYTVSTGIFLRYLLKNKLCGEDYTTQDIPLSVFEKLTSADMEEYIDYLSDYEDNGIRQANGNAAIKAKLAAVKAFLRFLYEEGYISHNPAESVKSPKVDPKEHRDISENDMEELFSAILNEKLFSGNKKQMEIHHRTMNRDYAIITLLYETGIRISELTELEIEDVDFGKCSLYIKGQNRSSRYVPLNGKALEALKKYLGKENSIVKEGTRASFGETEDKALFLSRKRRKMAPNSVEVMLHKYAAVVFGEKVQITPTGLRSACGRELYQKTGDINLVAETLGHSSKEVAYRFYGQGIYQKDSENAIDLQESRSAIE